MADDIMGELRQTLLTTDPATLDLAPTERLPRVWGALMEMGMVGGTASLVAVADGTTSLYLSTGGGVIGGGEQPRIRTASFAFLEVVESALDQMEPVSDPGTPEPDTVRFVALTYDGLRDGGAAEADLSAGTHPLSPLFFAGHEVLSGLREAAEAAE